MIELIGGVEGGSPIKNLLKKNGVCLYHLCFETDDIDTVLLKMREDAYIPVSEKRKSVIEGRDVVFLYHPNNCLIALPDGGGK